MKRRVITVILLIALIVLVGCNNTKKPEVNNDSKGNLTITKAKDFSEQYNDWTSQLESLAQKSNNAYSDWTNGKIKTAEFKNKIDQIMQEMNALNQKTDLNTTFNLSEKDIQKYNYDAVTKAYQKASKDLNDFFYITPHLNDQAIKTKYDEMIKTKYDNDISELKSLLKA